MLKTFCIRYTFGKDGYMSTYFICRKTVSQAMRTFMTELPVKYPEKSAEDLAELRILEIS